MLRVPRGGRFSGDGMVWTLGEEVAEGTSWRSALGGNGETARPQGWVNSPGCAHYATLDADLEIGPRSDARPGPPQVAITYSGSAPPRTQRRCCSRRTSGLNLARIARAARVARSLGRCGRNPP